jgi:UDP-glucose 4-epimerase
MKTLITGFSGFIGSNLAKMLKGSDFTGFDIQEHDLTSGPFTVPSTYHVIHLAALTNVRDSINEPAKFISSNIFSTLNALKTAYQSKTKLFTFTSSMSAAQPISPYGMSKLACEACCLNLANDFNLNLCIYRLPNIYGPHSVHKTSIIHKFIKSIIRKEPLTIYNDGSQTRDFLYVTDVCNLLLNPIPGLHSISTGSPISIIQLTTKLCDLSLKYLDYLPKITYEPGMVGEIEQVTAEKTFSPSILLNEGLDLTFKWYLENYA